MGLAKENIGNLKLFNVVQLGLTATVSHDCKTASKALMLQQW